MQDSARAAQSWTRELHSATAAVQSAKCAIEAAQSSRSDYGGHRLSAVQARAHDGLEHGSIGRFVCGQPAGRHHLDLVAEEVGARAGAVLEAPSPVATLVVAASKLRLAYRPAAVLLHVAVERGEADGDGDRGLDLALKLSHDLAVAEMPTVTSSWPCNASRPLPPRPGSKIGISKTRRRCTCASTVLIFRSRPAAQLSPP